MEARHELLPSTCLLESCGPYIALVGLTAPSHYLCKYQASATQWFRPLFFGLKLPRTHFDMSDNFDNNLIDDIARCRFQH